MIERYQSLQNMHGKECLMATYFGGSLDLGCYIETGL